ncbi:unnamed protein product [Prorocentrum cordatum]|uniref:Uncharacterized protein n=1 Tax=Prorocentrum cordatum TaxID=2364126 RepID=A0ABN9RDH9_9DINO|nr:unnamed protein product [Polarella glacialis]
MEAIRNAIPETPVIVAGAVGGPSVMFAVTPFRNGLTLGATNTRAGAMELYGSVFARGLAGGWTGGIYPAIAGCPQFLCLGPAYHFYAAFVGTAGGVVLTSLTESGIVFGAETCNAQMAKNAKAPGSIKNVHNSMKPWGTGFSIHFARNVIATAGGSAVLSGDTFGHCVDCCRWQLGIRMCCSLIGVHHCWIGEA